MSRQFYSMGRRHGEANRRHYKQIQTFINKCLRRMLHLKWTDQVSNSTLWKWIKQVPIENEIKTRKWRWIGPTLRKYSETITHQAASHGTPQGRGEEVGHEVSPYNMA